MLKLLIFIIGTTIGSFLNVCIYRIPNNQSIVFPPSHCTNCKTQLKPIDLIPILSYIFYRGRCSYCKESISIQYPLIELLTGLVFLLLFTNFGLTVEFVFYAILSALLIIISGIDYKHYIIPDGLVLTIFILGLIYKLTGQFYLKQPTNWTGSLMGFLLGGGFLFFIALVSSMGGGDIKLMAVLGFWLQWRLTILTMFLSFIIGAVLSIGLLALKIKSRKDVIPFGPFIALAAFIAILKGQPLLNWYLSNILLK